MKKVRWLAFLDKDNALGKPLKKRCIDEAVEAARVHVMEEA